MGLIFLICKMDLTIPTVTPKDGQSLEVEVTHTMDPVRDHLSPSPHHTDWS